jgi:SAM-dependent methyltransferase
VYRSPTPVSITSICTLLPRPTEVYFCAYCGHLQTPDLQHSGQYYDTHYKILADSEDEDQIYRIDNGKIVYRAQHQLDTLLATLTIPRGARVLDYGCAKAATSRRLLERRSDVVLYLFDVSRDYASYWENLATDDHRATYSLPDSWRGQLDVVVSYFVLEHVNDAFDVVSRIHTLLRPGGAFYFVVPDLLANIGDFVVADHVNHFTPASIHHMLAAIGFEAIEVDAKSHLSAYVVSARKTAVVARTIPPPDAELARRVQEMAAYWQSFGDRAREFERANQGRISAIYGSGFYGTFVAACLEEPAAVSCFLDQNPYRQGKTLLNKPILPPAELPAGVEAVYVGLNPARAREEIAKVDAWRGRSLSYFYP